jgi:tetratricopeptide (TPR) repeat protein
MPQVEAVKPKKNRRGVARVVAVLIAVLLVVAAGMYLNWLFNPSVASQVAKATNLDASNNFSQAEKVLKAALPRAINKNDKENVLQGLGATEYDLAKYPESVSYYQQANSLDPGQESILFELAQAAQSAQNNSVELSADKQLLPIVQAQDNGPTRQADINDLQNRIAELQK